MTEWDFSKKYPKFTLTNIMRVNANTEQGRGN